MRKSLVIVIACIVAVLGVSGYLWYTLLRGVKPAILPPPSDITDDLKEEEELPPGQNKTNFPLTLPDGFRIEVFAKDLPGARVMAFDGRGNMWVSRTKQGAVTLLDVEEAGITQHDIFKGLKNPHGLVFDLAVPGRLYIAEEDRVSFADVYRQEQPPYRSPSTSDYEVVQMGLAVSSVMLPQTLIDLPDSGRHFTRTLFWAGDNKLYISIGSTCDVCEEKDSRHASIMRIDLEEKKLVPVATGLRNSVFAATHLVTGDTWATEMGRDFLGDNLPPDEINIVKEGKNYGWPLCYGKKIHDTQFDSRQYVRDPCEDTEGSYIDLPAHVAPLGLGFIPEEGWPEEYWYDLLIAVHGSWNRSEPIGYKVIRIALDAQGKPERLDANGKPVTEDFISGWLTEGERALGRPVDLLIQSGGVMYISDDKAGVIYKVTYRHDTTIRNFEECVAAGYPVMESYPRQCREPGGKTFTENIGNELEKADLIRVSSPRPNTTISSPLQVEGEARGTWYFEASFPIRVLDGTGKEVGVGHAEAQSDWMTEEFVPFKGTILFSVPEGVTTGTVIFEKDNPSGLTEYADELRMPITF